MAMTRAVPPSRRLEGDVVQPVRLWLRSDHRDRVCRPDVSLESARLDERVSRTTSRGRVVRSLPRYRASAAPRASYRARRASWAGTGAGMWAGAGVRVRPACGLRACSAGVTEAQSGACSSSIGEGRPPLPARSLPFPAGSRRGKAPRLLSVRTRALAPPRASALAPWAASALAPRAALRAGRRLRCSPHPARRSPLPSSSSSQHELDGPWNEPNSSSSLSGEAAPDRSLRCLRLEAPPPPLPPPLPPLRKQQRATPAKSRTEPPPVSSTATVAGEAPPASAAMASAVAAPDSGEEDEEDEGGGPASALTLLAPSVAMAAAVVMAACGAQDRGWCPPLALQLPQEQRQPAQNSEHCRHFRLK